MLFIHHYGFDITLLLVTELSKMLLHSKARRTMRYLPLLDAVVTVTKSLCGDAGCGGELGILAAVQVGAPLHHLY